MQEDLRILSYVETKGRKWARISRIWPFRNEHDVKNRFFALLAIFLEAPIKNVKKMNDCMKTDTISQARHFFQNRNAIKVFLI